MIKRYDINIKKTPQINLRKSIGNTKYSELQSMFFVYDEYEKILNNFMNNFMHVICNDKDEEISKLIAMQMLELNESELEGEEKEKSIIRLILCYLPIILSNDIYIENAEENNTSYMVWDFWHEDLFEFCKNNKTKSGNLILVVESKLEDKKIYKNDGALIILMSMFTRLLNQEFLYKKTDLIKEVFSDLKEIEIKI